MSVWKLEREDMMAAQESLINDIEEVYGSQTFRVNHAELHLVLVDIWHRVSMLDLVPSRCYTMSSDLGLPVRNADVDVLVGFDEEGLLIVGVYPIFPEEV